ncbi:MAG: hypothetical protein ABIN04_15270 [Ginsengibacter sp.]
MTYRIEIDIPNEEVYSIDVEFEGYPKLENDSVGGLDTGIGIIKDSGHDYVSMESKGHATWGRSLYKKEENEAIEINIENVDEEMCEIYKNDLIQCM